MGDKSSPEVKARAVWLGQEHQQDYPSVTAAARARAKQLGLGRDRASVGGHCGRRFRRRMRRTLAAAAAAVLALSTLIPVPAQAVTYSPTAGAIFNIPDGVGGTLAQQRRWLDTVTNMTDATPAGELIIITMLSIYDPEVITALQRADHRGVNVQIVLSAVKVSASTAKLRDDLNDGSNPGSWFKSCRESCSGPSGIGVAHAKIFTVSNFNGPKGPIMDTTIIGTGNLTSGGSKTSFNSWHVIPNNRALYVGATNVILGMRADVPTNLARYTVVWAGAYTLLTLPQVSSTPDPILNVLNTTQCATTRGHAGRTVIRVAQFYWSNARISIARRLAVLKRGGCNVAVIYASIDRAVLKVLLEARIPVYDSVSHGTYNHGKTLIVSGRLGATDGDLVSQGSANWSYPNLVHNDETVFRIRSKSTTDKYRAMWTRWASWSTRTTKLPSPSTADARAKARLLTEAMAEEG